MIDPHAKAEPAISVYTDMAALPEGQPVTVLTLLRFRRDVADGFADQAFSSWSRIMDGIAADHEGCCQLTLQIIWNSLGKTGHWDRVTTYRYPTRKGLFRSTRDARMFDNLDIRRQAVEASPSYLLLDNDLGQSIQARTSHTEANPHVYIRPAWIHGLKSALSAMPDGQPFVFLNLTRLRCENSYDDALEAYVGWRSVWLAVAVEHGVEVVLDGGVDITFVAGSGIWDFAEAARYKSLAMFEAVANDPRILAASALRAAAVEDTLALAGIEMVNAVGSDAAVAATISEQDQKGG
jgi:hypothetical protein